MVLSPDRWRALVLTLYPDMFPGPLGQSLAGRGLADNIWQLATIDIREFATDRHRSVDDTPAGGGPGMVMRADVVGNAIDRARREASDLPLIYLSPRGHPLSQRRVRQLVAGPGVILLAGRFEGIDQRVLDAKDVEEVSLGDFVLSGGELAAMALVDACVRLLPGIVGDKESLEQESFENGLLEYPHYTRPREWEGRKIPDVLLSGDHGRIDAWRKGEAERTTRERRPDLWSRYRKT